MFWPSRRVLPQIHTPKQLQTTNSTMLEAICVKEGEKKKRQVPDSELNARPYCRSRNGVQLRIGDIFKVGVH
jgi:hypothetical protein